jgi:hypothetical protein
MQAVSPEEFVRWAGGLGIGVDPRYPDSGCLSYLPPTDHARFWVVPDDPATWADFVGSLLGGLDEWSLGLLWPRSGRWPSSQRSQAYNERVRDIVLRGAGIPDGWAGAVRVDRAEEDVLIALLFAFMAFGGCVDDDVFFIAEHGRQLLQVDHHGVIHAACVSEERMQGLIAHMAAAEYELPRDSPDATFRRPGWMGHA